MVDWSATMRHAACSVGTPRRSSTSFGGNALSARGSNTRPLLQAALLHDVAKREVGLVYRVGVIALNKISPSALPRVASANPRSWRNPFYVSLHHPKMGAELAAPVT